MTFWGQSMEAPNKLKYNQQETINHKNSESNIKIANKQTHLKSLFVIIHIKIFKIVDTLKFQMKDLCSYHSES